MPTEDQLEEYYRDEYRTDIGKGRRPTKSRLWRIAEAGVDRALDVLSRVRTPLNSMDVGCGAGELVFMLAAAGCNARGFDPDSNYMQWARGLMGEKVERNRIQDVIIQPKSLDVVTMFHVLEHMPEPGYVLNECAGWLKEGGLLMVEVPNLESIVQAPGHQYLKVHLQYFNKETLTALASRSGLRFEDGGPRDRGENLRCYFRRDSQARLLEGENVENANHVLRVLEEHRSLSHYLSLSPYRRVWHRLSRTTRETMHSFMHTDDAILKLFAADLCQQLRKQESVRS